MTWQVVDSDTPGGAYIQVFACDGEHGAPRLRPKAWGEGGEVGVDEGEHPVRRAGRAPHRRDRLLVGDKHLDVTRELGAGLRDA